MLVSCKKGCILNGGTTNARLNIETDEIICDFCEDKMDNISDFTKRTMRDLRDIVRNKVIAAFTFYCKECDRNVETIEDDGKAVGLECKGQRSCSIDISDIMLQVVKDARK